MAERSKKKVFSYGQNKRLKDEYRNGLTSVKLNQAKIKALAKELGMQESCIKNYIHNKNGAARGRKRSKTPSANPRQTNARALFMKEFLSKEETGLSQGDKMSKGSLEWKKLSDEQKAVYRERATRMKPQSPSTFTEPQRRVYLGQLQKEMLKLKDKFSKVDVDVVSMTVDRKELSFRTTATRNGTDFLEKYPDLENNFIGFCTSFEQQDEDEENRKELRQKVQQLFNKKYDIAIGKPGNRFPYERAAKGDVRVMGLPAGIVLKRPSFYGREALRLIIAASDSITVKVAAKKKSTLGSTSYSAEREHLAGAEDGQYAVAADNKSSKATLESTAVSTEREHVAVVEDWQGAGIAFEVPVTLEERIALQTLIEDKISVYEVNIRLEYLRTQSKSDITSHDHSLEGNNDGEIAREPEIQTEPQESSRSYTIEAVLQKKRKKNIPMVKVRWESTWEEEGKYDVEYVEEIMKKKTEDGKSYHLVHWKDDWIQESNLD